MQIISMLNSHPMPLAHLILILLVITVWGFNFIAIKLALVELPPILLCAFRFFLTSVPAIFFVKRPKVPFKMVLSYGLVMFALQFTLVFMGMFVGVTPGLASLLLQVHVFFSTLLALLFFQEKIHVSQIIGGLLSFLGIGLIGINLEASSTILGFTLIVAAAAAWGAGNVISKKMGKVDVLSLVIWGSFIAWPPLLLLSLFAEGTGPLYSLSHLTLIPTASALYIAYLSTLFCYGVWSWMLHRYPLSTVAPFTLAVPVLAMLSSVLVFNEPLQWWKIAAGILVLTGLCVNLLGPRILKKFKKS